MHCQKQISRHSCNYRVYVGAILVFLRHQREYQHRHLQLRAEVGKCPLLTFKDTDGGVLNTPLCE